MCTFFNSKQKNGCFIQIIQLLSQQTREYMSLFLVHLCRFGSGSHLSHNFIISHTSALIITLPWTLLLLTIDVEEQTTNWCKFAPLISLSHPHTHTSTHIITQLSSALWNGPMLMNPEQKRHTFMARWERGGVTEREREGWFSATNSVLAGSSWLFKFGKAVKRKER